MYTKTGDKGTSSLYNGSRKSKDDAIFEALGNTDELNAAIGVAREHTASLSGCSDLAEQLVDIQSRLLDIGSAIATPASSSSATQLERVAFDEEHVSALEAWIDTMDATLPPLRNFILPVSALATVSLPWYHTYSTAHSLVALRVPICTLPEQRAAGLSALSSALCKPAIPLPQCSGT